MVLRNALDELVEVLNEAPYLKQMNERCARSPIEGHLHLGMIGRTLVTTADSLVQNSWKANQPGCPKANVVATTYCSSCSRCSRVSQTVSSTSSFSDAFSTYIGWKSSCNTIYA